MSNVNLYTDREYMIYVFDKEISRFLKVQNSLIIRLNLERSRNITIILYFCYKGHNIRFMSNQYVIVNSFTPIKVMSHYIYLMFILLKRMDDQLYEQRQR